MLHEESPPLWGQQGELQWVLVRSSKLPKIPFSGHYTHKYFHKHMPAVPDTVNPVCVLPHRAHCSCMPPPRSHNTQTSPWLLIAVISYQYRLSIASLPPQ